MIFFRSDYSLGAHPRILDALSKTNMVHTDGYSEDEFCYKAADLIKSEIGRTDADIHFMVGGTPANLISAAAFLRDYQSIVAVDSAHICKHETGAIEATGHKIHYMPSKDGKLCPSMVQAVLDQWEDEHMVVPKMAYISQPTEIGTVYSKAELMALRNICDDNDMYLYIDGARLGSALTCHENDLTLKDLAQIADAFYIGATKNGALFGEALVIIKPELKTDFRFYLKQRGGMLAKGRLFGVQFLELFKDGLYYELAGHANKMASALRDGIKGAGYDFLVDTPTNQIFPILPNTLISHLEKQHFFYIWQPYDEKRSVIRLVTSWGTTEEDVMTFLRDL